MSCNVNMMKSWIYYSLKKSLKTSLNLSYGCMKNLRSDCKSWRMNSLSKNMMTGSKMMKMTLSLKNYKENNNPTCHRNWFYYLEEPEQDEELDKEHEELEEWLEQHDEEEDELEEDEPRNNIF